LVVSEAGRNSQPSRLVDALRVAGVPVPRLVDLGPATPTGLLVTESIQRTPGAELLAQPGGATPVGRLLGSVWRRLSRVDPTGLPLPSDWSGATELAKRSTARLRHAEASLGDPE